MVHLQDNVDNDTLESANRTDESGNRRYSKLYDAIRHDDVLDQAGTTIELSIQKSDTGSYEFIVEEHGNEGLEIREGRQENVDDWYEYGSYGSPVSRRVQDLADEIAPGQNNYSCSQYEDSEGSRTTIRFY